MSQMQNRVFLLLTLAMAIAVMAPGSSLAVQPESPRACVEGSTLHLAYGDHTTGCEIGEPLDLDAFTFDGAAGDLVRVLVRSTSPLDARLRIYDQGGGDPILDTYCNDNCSLIEELTLSGTETYTIFISDQGGDQAGAYALQIERILPPPTAQLLEYGTPASDQISPTTDHDFFAFEGAQGTEIRINIRSSSPLDARLEVWDPDGVKLEDVYCNDNCSLQRETPDFSVLPSAALPKTGTYLVAVSDAGINQTGSYTIDVHCLLGSCPAVQANIPYDTAVSDTIATMTEMDFFTFDGIAGTKIRVHVRSSSPLDTRLEIWDPNGQKLEDVFCLDNCSLQRETPDFSVMPSVTLPITGTYLLAVSDAGINQTGSYEASIHCLVGPCDPTILYFITEERGLIETRTDMDFFEFWGTSGTQIRINVRSSSPLDTRLEIWDPDGEQLEDIFCYDNCSLQRETPDFSVIPSATLPKTGLYRLAVSDAGINETGSYRIGIHCLRGECDSDADGIVDELPKELPYSLTDDTRSIELVTDMDFFTFWGVAGTQIQLQVRGWNPLDARLEVWDPDGLKLEDVFCSDSCTLIRETSDFSLLPSPTVPKTGRYLVAVSDAGTNEEGNYELRLDCLFGSCADEDPPPPQGGDNCTEWENGPLAPDAGGNVQLDEDGDGYGNACDCDFDQNLTCNVDDFSIFRVDFWDTYDSGVGTDMDGSGRIGIADFSRFRSGFSAATPGPSGLTP
jgi:hypothetical protein